MGIVAFCPNGHRVKVRDELAGRKGICPQCQSRFRIPKNGEASLPTARVVSLDPDVAAALPRALLPGQPAVAAPAAVASPVPPPVSPPVAQPVAFHPVLAERPDRTWCVALPGGQPSAPLPVAAMQQWLDGGTITGDELVWRDDWPEWIEIRRVFPDRLPPTDAWDPG